MKDYYQILGIDKNATKDEIKKAFHKLAHKYHPDKKDGNETKFKEVNEAYQTLSNEERRRQYDTFGQNGPGFGGQGGFGNGAWDFSNFARAAGNGGVEFDLGDIFGEFFRGQSGGGARAKRGRDISVDIQISFSEAVFGTERKVLINKISACSVCSGAGAKPGSKMKKCASCGGKGSVHDTRRSFFGTFTTTQECSSCQGAGEIPEEKCNTCAGLGVLEKPEEIKIVVPSGIENGEMIRLAGQGEAAPRGVSGDLYVRVHVEKHKTFRRDGSNLVMDLPVKLTDALLGTEYPLETLDGSIKLKIPAGINYGEILRVRGRGIPYPGNKRGDLLVRVVIKNPAKLSRKARQLIDDLKKEGI